MNSYDYFAKFYRELIAVTGRLQVEEYLLDELMSQLKVDREANILDAACGTGDALLHLFNKGYLNLTGLDGSKGMLDRAQQLLGDLPFHHYRWIDLKVFSELMHDTYDLILLLSNSLAHAKANEFPSIFKSFHKMLKPEGYLVFDIREWVQSPEGTLIEPNRPVYVNRFLATIELDSDQWLIEDKCWYTKYRQIVRYICSPMHSAHFKDSLKLDVDYALVTADEFISKLSSVGFKETSILKYKDWPYLMLISPKL